jgi:hypothetical protein
MRRIRPAVSLAALCALAALAAAAAAPATWHTGEPTCQVFPANNPWNTDISKYPLHPRSDAYIDAIGRADHLHPDVGTVWQGAPIGIPYAIVGAGQAKVPVSFYYDGESDPGPYPVPPDAPIEGGASSGGDRHVIVVDEGACKLYEMFDAHPVSGGQSWQAGSGAVFSLNSNALRPDFWTSADAAGLPIFAGLVRYSEVMEQGAIDHALRFTVSQTRRAFIHPATHFASSATGTNVPPMGLRLRMKAGFSCAAFSQEVKVICAALKKYGMIVADNGSDWYVSGAPDGRWDDDALGDLKSITGDAFEVVYTGQMISDVPIPDQVSPPAAPPPSGSTPTPKPPAPGPTPAASGGRAPGAGATPTPSTPAPVATPIPTPRPTPSPMATSTASRYDEPGGDEEESSGGDGWWTLIPLMIGLPVAGAGGAAFWVRRRRRTRD